MELAEGLCAHLYATLPRSTSLGDDEVTFREGAGEPPGGGDEDSTSVGPRSGSHCPSSTTTQVAAARTALPGAPTVATSVVDDPRLRRKLAVLLLDAAAQRLHELQEAEARLEEARVSLDVAAGADGLRKLEAAVLEAERSRLFPGAEGALAQARSVLQKAQHEVLEESRSKSQARVPPAFLGFWRRTHRGVAEMHSGALGKPRYSHFTSPQLRRFKKPACRTPTVNLSLDDGAVADEQPPAADTVETERGTSKSATAFLLETPLSPPGRFCTTRVRSRRVETLRRDTEAARALGLLEQSLL